MRSLSNRGIIIADTKLEFGIWNDEVILIDEVLTPDSSRFWPVDGYRAGGAQPSFDKQPVRDWMAANWKDGDPLPAIPPAVVAATTDRYVAVYKTLTGEELPARATGVHDTAPAKRGGLCRLRVSPRGGAMKTAVVLRHAERQDRSNNWSHLSQVGIEQAHRAGSRFERFDMVVTSPLPRAVETAVAMGFAVSRTHPGIQDIGERILEHVRWNDGFAAWARGLPGRHARPILCGLRCVASFRLAR